MHWRTRQLLEQNAKAETAQTTPTRAPIAEPAVATVAPEPQMLTVKLERDRFDIFARIAAREERSIKALITECLNGCSVQVARIEAQNMRLAAAASDERERRGYDVDHEFEHRRAGAGYVEICLALES